MEARLYFQVALTAAGHWSAVPNISYSRRLHEAIRQYQYRIGQQPTGVLTEAQVTRLIDDAGPVLKGWGLRSAKHPERGRPLWVPMGLDLRAERTAAGVVIADPKNQFRLRYEYLPGASLQEKYEAVQTDMAAGGDNIEYKLIKPDFFVVAANKHSKYHRYSRFHRDGSGLLGFEMWWSNDAAPVFGDRLVTLVSGSFWASMTGASFPSVKPVAYPWQDNEPPVAARPSTPASAATEASPEKKGVSTGSGFFVTHNGHVLTNAHVIEGCSTIMVRTNSMSVVPGRVMTRDVQNDLAIVKIDQAAEKIIPIRSGVRLGESIAAFGFPHSDMLSTTGNFTLGNVTALAGLGDDSRYLQVSAPVQAGNSGGPLLDAYGNLVGVVSAKLNAVKVMAASGDLPQNVNFAIKATLAAILFPSFPRFEASAI